MDKKPMDNPHQNIFKQTSDFKKELLENKKNEEKDELTPLKKLNHKLGVYLTPDSQEITENEKKKKIGVAITALILITLIISGYYFIIYEPYQEDLSLARTTKLNELHELYKGPLASAPNEIMLEDKINHAESPEEIEMINIISPATKDWTSFHKKSVNANQDKYNRTMVVYSNETKNIIIPAEEAFTIINENDVHTLANIKFEKPNTVSVPVLISRLQAGAGLINVGSIVDIYTQDNYTNVTQNTSADISGCTVLSIMRYDESGEIDSEYSKSNMMVNGNITTPKENTKSFSSDVLEILKGAIINGYDEKETIDLLSKYGVKLSNYERQINLGDLDAKYMLLIETPKDKVTYILNNMENIVLTIPTDNAPSWMVNEINSTQYQ